MYGNICAHNKSFVGRDYKGWSQIAPFILYPYVSEGMKHVLLCLTKVYILFCVDYLNAQTSMCNIGILHSLLLFFHANSSRRLSTYM